MPNALTIGRLVAAPAMAALVALHPDGSIAVAAIFLVVAVSDCVDGYVARSRDAVTTFGTLMDPVVDKVLVMSAMFTLVAVDRLAAWVALVVLARELAVTGLRLLAAREGTVIPAGGLGKAKMWTQVATVAALAAVGDPGAEWVQALVYSTAVVTVLSGLDYFLGYWRGGRQVAPQAS